MRRFSRQWMGLALVAACLAACGGQPEANEKEGVETVLPASVAEVSVMTLKKQAFEHELVSNGKVEAKRYAALQFRTTTEPVARIYVKNGDRVKKGQKIAELDLFTLQNKLTQAEYTLEQAQLEMQDVLIGQGYAPDRMEAVPEEVKKLAATKSGYGQSKAAYELAKRELEQATLTVPFDGIVADLDGKEYNMPESGKPFCRILSTTDMEVAFTVLESELPLVKAGDRVEVMPYTVASGSLQGRIAEINPSVDENGMVKVKALVNGKGRLFDGMNARVSVKRSVPGQLVIPKTAVVLRSGKQVVFTLKDGKAIWNYVQTGLENMTEYTVTGDGMEEGAVVITTGNVNLAHETPVKVVE